MGIPSDDHLHGYSFNQLWNVPPGQAEQLDILNIPLKEAVHNSLSQRTPNLCHCKGVDIRLIDLLRTYLRRKQLRKTAFRKEYLAALL